MADYQEGFVAGWLAASEALVKAMEAEQQQAAPTFIMREHVDRLMPPDYAFDVAANEQGERRNGGRRRKSSSASRAVATGRRGRGRSRRTEAL